jgi:hypothetical protein
VKGGQRAGFNVSTNDSWSLESGQGEGFIDFSFSLASVPAQAHLMVMHMTTGDGDAKNGGFAPVDVLVNGTQFKENFDVAETHGDPQEFEFDLWNVSALLVSGANTIRFDLDESAETFYWIQHLALIDSAGSADLRGSSIEVSSGLQVAPDTNAVFNTSTNDSWMLTGVQNHLEFWIDYASVPSNAYIAIVHMTSGDLGATNNGYSPVDISINGQVFKQKYDVAEAHGTPQKFEIDLWRVSDYLDIGANRIRIELNEASETQYWIQNFAITN